MMKNFQIKSFKIPPKSAGYVVYQRTQYQSIIGKLMKIIRLESLYNNHLLNFVEQFRTSKVQKCYFNDIKEDYLEIKRYLPTKAENILDIGSGMAGIDVFLYFHYQNPSISLLDKQGVSKIFYNFNKEASYYNSFHLTEQFLKENGVPKNKIDTIDVEKQSFPLNEKFDLIVSLISWGFHYPVHTYLSQVDQVLSQGGGIDN